MLWYITTGTCHYYIPCQNKTLFDTHIVISSISDLDRVRRHFDKTETRNYVSPTNGKLPASSVLRLSSIGPLSKHFGICSLFPWCYAASRFYSLNWQKCSHKLIVRWSLMHLQVFEEQWKHSGVACIYHQLWPIYFGAIFSWVSRSVRECLSPNDFLDFESYFQSLIVAGLKEDAAKPIIPLLDTMAPSSLTY